MSFLCKSVVIVVFIWSFFANSCYAQASSDSDLAAMKKQLEAMEETTKKQLGAMEETIKKQQEMINDLKNEIGTKVVDAESNISAVSGNNEREFEQAIDNYLMKEETRDKMVKSGLTPEYFYWDNGLRFKTGDGKFKFKVGGRVMNDWGWFEEDNELSGNVGDQVDGSEFRRSRVYLSGNLYENIGFKIQYDFAGDGRPDFKNVYMKLKEVPILGAIQVGHYKEPFGLEETTSSKYITFMERSLNNVFAPGYGVGFMSYNHALDERLTWAAGVFRSPSNDWGDSEGLSSTEGGYSFSGRITGLPLYEDEGKKLIHTGFSYSYQNAFENVISYSSGPEMHMASSFVDTGIFAAESVHIFNPELAFKHGPLSLQAEYTYANTELPDSSVSSDSHFSGFYVYGSYFLTGEHRKYSTDSGEFSRVKPNRNFIWGKGIGAIELAARYSHLDLSDEAIDGGRLGDVTLGINWYLNPNTRVMFNYVHADPDFTNTSSNSDGNADLAAMRFQIDF